MGKNLNNDNWGKTIFSSILAVLLIWFGSSYIKDDLKESAPEAKQEEAITDFDVSEVKNNTNSFLTYFEKGKAIDEQILTDLTFNFFNQEFLKNEFSDKKSALFGLYGYERLMNTFTSLEGIKHEGGIKSFEIEDIQKDNSNRTITTYIRMDSLELNTVHWIEWRKIPGEGWKINAVSFHGTIDILRNPLSPKKQL